MRTETRNGKRFMVQTDHELAERIEKVAKLYELSCSDVIRFALLKYFKKGATELAA